MTMKKILSDYWQVIVVAGTFSQIPVCVATAANSANAIAVTHGGGTTAVFSFSTNITTSGAASDSFADIICIGPR